VLKQRIVFKNVNTFLLEKTIHFITEMERIIKYGIHSGCHVSPNEYVSSLEAWQAFVEEKQKIQKNFSSASKGLQAGPANTVKLFS